MSNIAIVDLYALGSGLFSDSESFIDSMQDLSENELKRTVGGGGSRKTSRKSSHRKSSRKGSKRYCY